MLCVKKTFEDLRGLTAGKEFVCLVCGQPGITYDPQTPLVIILEYRARSIPEYQWVRPKKKKNHLKPFETF